MTPTALVELQAAFIDALATQADTDRCDLRFALEGLPGSGSLRANDVDWIWTRDDATLLVESAELVVRLHEPLHDPTAFDALQWAVHTNQSLEDAQTALSALVVAGILVDTSVSELAPHRHRLRPIGLQPLSIPWLGPWHGNEGSVELHAGPEILEIDGAALSMLDTPFRHALGDFDPFVDTPDIGTAATRRLAECLRAGARASVAGYDAQPAVTRPLREHDLRWSIAEWLSTRSTVSIVRT